VHRAGTPLTAGFGASPDLGLGSAQLPQERFEREHEVATGRLLVTGSYPGLDSCTANTLALGAELTKAAAIFPVL